MAAADSNAQDRNLPASQRKLKKARADGQVARSRDFGHFAAIATCGAALVAGAPQLAHWLEEMLTRGLHFDAASVRDPAFMGERLAEMTVLLLAVVVPFGLLMAGAALLGAIAIGGWNWTLKPIAPDFSRLNPLSGLIGMIKKEKLVNACKGAATALLLGAIGGFYFKAHIDAFTALLGLSLPAAIGEAGREMIGGLTLLLGVLALFALIDVPLQRFQHAQRLKMSHQELKQEHKELEGNQEIKAKMRAKMREASKRRMMAAVPTADLVVMNPTHYAVALKYDEKKMGAPRVVAKGADLMAMAIRDLAQGSKVPVLQAPALARALYTHAELDREIPAALFAAVAQVLAYVYQLRAALQGQGTMPAAMPELHVPPELDPNAGSAAV